MASKMTSMNHAVDGMPLFFLASSGKGNYSGSVSKQLIRCLNTKYNHKQPAPEKPMEPEEFLTEDEFIRLKDQDKLVFKKVYVQYFALVMYVVKRCGITQAECEDVVQDIFLKLFHQAASIQDRNSIKAWLSISARNLALDHLRRQKTRTDKAEEIKYSVQQTAAQSDGTLLKELEVVLIGNLLIQIEQETGDSTLTLFYREGLTASEIARRNNEPVSTVTNRLSRMRKRFRDYFVDHLQQLSDSVQ